MSKANMQTSLNTNSTPKPTSTPQCTICGGVGYLREDHPLQDPRFGKITPCVCRQAVLQAESSDRLYQFSNLTQLRHMTFDKFNPRGRVGLSVLAQKSLEQAFRLAYSFAQTRKGWLLLEGGYGCGKTHLAAAIANYSVDHGVPTLFLTAPDLLDWLRAAFDSTDDTFSSRFESLREVPLLVMDDFGTQNATPWAQEKLFQLLDYRYVNGLPTVITSNLRMDEIEGRLRSRLADAERVHHVQILAPDYRQPMEEFGSIDLSSLYLHQRQTFASFSMRTEDRLTDEDGRSLRIAFGEAKKMAEAPAGWLMLLGSYGCGKTHLAAAVANHREEQGYPSLFVVVPDLLDYLRSTFNPNSAISYDRMFEQIRSARLLVLDDLGAHNTTPWAKEKLFQLLNYRYNAELPTVITSAMDLEEMDPRIRTRLLDTGLCTICAITAPAFRGGKSSSRIMQPKRPTKKTSK